MGEQVFFLNMFPDYVPPEDLHEVLSQAAIVAADIDPGTHFVSVVIHSETYIPQRVLEQVQRELTASYGLRRLELNATHPASQLQKIEPEVVLRFIYFVSCIFFAICVTPNVLLSSKHCKMRTAR